MNLNSETDKAWLAGFIDGEGYIGITKHRKKANRQQSASWLYHPWLVVTNTNTSALDYLQSAVSSQKRVSLRRTAVSWQKAAFQVKITRFDEVVRVLEAVLPYLKVKLEQAKLVVKFCKIRMSSAIITGRGSRGQTSFGCAEEEIYLKLRELNKRGI